MALAAISATATPLVPQPVACTGAPVLLQGASAFEARIACEGAKAAFDFMAPLHLAGPVGVTVLLAASLPAGAGRQSMGCFEPTSGRVVVLRYRTFARRGDWFGIPTDALLYRSLVTHEVAHAIAAVHAGERRLPRVAQEYVGYVTMLATMDPGLRERLLEHNPGDGFEHTSQMSELILSIDPKYFALESYRHWIGQSDPPGFLRRVLDGQEIRGTGG